MAAPSRTKLVVLVLLALLSLAAALSVSLFFRRQADPVQLAQRADQLAAQGRHLEAAQHYAQAAQLQPLDASLLTRQARALTQVPASDAASARRTLEQARDLWTRALQLDPSSSDALASLLQLDQQTARELQQPAAWQRTFDLCEGVLKSKPSPAVRQLALKHRAIARVYLPSNQPAADRTQLLLDFEQARAAAPGDPELLYHLALWLVSQAQLHPDTAAAADDRAQATRLVNDALSRLQQNRVEQIEYLPLLVELGMLDRASTLADQARNAILEQPAAVPTRAILILVQQAPLLAARRQEGAAAVESNLTLLQAAVLAKPSDVRLRFAQAQQLRLAGQLEQALAAFAQVRSLPLASTPTEVLRDAQLRHSAALQHAELSIDDIARQSDAHRRDAAIARAQTSLEQLAQALGQVPVVQMLQGKLAVARADWSTAARLFDAASDQLDHRSVDALLLAAHAWQQLGEPVHVIERLQRVLELAPQAHQTRLDLARLFLQQRQFTQAQEQIDRVLADQPTHAGALALEAALKTQTGQISDALSAYEKIDPRQNPQAVLAQVQLLLTSDQPDAARALLESHLDQQPGNLQFLQQLIRMSQSPEQARAYIDKARTRGANPALLELLQSSTAGDAGTLEAMLKLVAGQNELDTHLARARVYQQFNQLDDASRELAAAAALNPDHAQVIHSRFELALTREDWPLVTQLSETAARLNLDSVDGLIYRGRAEAAQDQLDAAAATYQKIIDSHPDNAAAWVLLAHVQRTQTHWSAARASYAQALKLQPANLAALLGQAAVLDQLQLHSEALTMLRRAHRAAPARWDIATQYMAYEQQHGDPVTVLTLRQQRARAMPGDLANRRAMALLLTELKRFDEAQTVAAELLALEQEKRANLDVALRVRQAAGDADGAIKMLEDRLTSLGADATIEDWLLLIRQLRAAGRIDAALTACDRAAAFEKAPLRPATREKADILFESGRFAEAAALYQQMLSNNADDVRLVQRCAESLLRAGDADKARPLLEPLLARSDVDATTFLLAASLHAAQQDQPAALRYFERAQSLAPEWDAIYLARAELLARDPAASAQTLADLQRVLSITPASIRARELLALVHQRDQHYDQAAHELRTILAQQPAYLPARVQLAQVYQLANDRAALDALLTESARLAPQDPRWERIRAQQKLRDDDLVGAASHLEKALTLSATPAGLEEAVQLLIKARQFEQALGLLDQYKNLRAQSWRLPALQGVALAQLDRIPQAAAAFDAAAPLCVTLDEFWSLNDTVVSVLGRGRGGAWLRSLEAAPDVRWVALLQARLALESGQAADARKQLDELEPQLAAGSIELHHQGRLKALALHQLGETANAIALYQQSLARDATDVMVLNNLAILLVETPGQADQALAYAQQATQLAPQSPQVLGTLGWCQFNAKQVDEAAVTLRRAIGLQPTALNCFRLAQILEAGGDVTGARQQLLQAQKLAQAASDANLLTQIEVKLAALAGE